MSDLQKAIDLLDTVSETPFYKVDAILDQVGDLLAKARRTYEPHPDDMVCLASAQSSDSHRRVW